MKISLPGAHRSFVRKFEMFKTWTIRNLRPLSGAQTPFPHPGDNLLEAYTMGTLAQELLPELEEHLLSCDPCRLRLEELEGFVRIFRTAAEDIEIRPLPAHKKYWNLRLMTWAVTPVAAAILLFLAEQPHVSTGLPKPAVILHPFRGAETPVEIKSGTDFQMVLDAPLEPSLDSYPIQIVDRSGHPVRTLTVEARDERLTFACSKLSHGTYWVRIYGSAREQAPLVEYRLQVE
jgi:hypothetical protein